MFYYIGCGGTLTSVTGSIVSPNYPEPYGANSECIYKISVAMGSKITLNFMDLDLENSDYCESDFLEVIIYNKFFNSFFSRI